MPKKKASEERTRRIFQRVRIKSAISKKVERKGEASLLSRYKREEKNKTFVVD